MSPPVTAAKNRSVASRFLVDGDARRRHQGDCGAVEAATLLDKGPDFCARSWRSVCWATADAGEAAAQEQGPGSG
jgi:hypothetical protein